MEDASGWFFAIVIGPALLGAILVYAILRNRRRRVADIRSPSYDETDSEDRSGRS